MEEKIIKLLLGKKVKIENTNKKDLGSKVEKVISALKNCPKC